MLTGKESVSVKAYGHQELEIFGVGDDQDDKYWDAVIRHALIEGLIVKEIENYGLLKISDKGREYLKKPYSILITKNHDYSDMEDESRAGGGTAAVDLELFSLLKDLRKEISRKLNLPPFVIFQDLAGGSPPTILLLSKNCRIC